MNIEIVIIGIVFIIAGLLMGIGVVDKGGPASNNIYSMLGLILWIGGVIYAFISNGVKFGLIALVVSTIINGITNVISKAIILKMRGKP